MQQAPLFTDLPRYTGRQLPALGEQKDIRYLGIAARSVLNDPRATGMDYWSINPYIGCAIGCGYCYARFAHRYALDRALSALPASDPAHDVVGQLPPWLAFERRILVKRNAPEVLARALREGGPRHLALVRGDAVLVGTATDPYQPAERRFRVTRGILETLAEHPGLRVVIITKSPLVTRDIPVLARIARHSTVSVHVSLITLDREISRKLEPRAPTPEARIRALARLREAGIEAGVNVMPVLPGITDHPTALEALVKRIAEVGVRFAGACALRLRSDARARYFMMIDEHFPHLSARYRRAYASHHELGDHYRAGLARVFAGLCAAHGVTPRPSRDDDGDAPLVAGLDQLSLELG